jgi:hypothetical protein
MGRFQSGSEVTQIPSHKILRIRRQRKARFLIQTVCSLRAKQECSERRHNRIFHHALQKRSANSPTAPRRIDNEILNVTKRGVVCDYTRKADLALPLVSAKTKGVLYGTLEHFPWAIAGPMSLPQEFVDEFDVETLKAALYFNSIS